MSVPDLNQGALAPVADEVELSNLAVIGQVPPELNGMLIRNGPNPLTGRFEGEDVLAWWPEAAMLHGIYFEDGRVTQYRNRWVRTRAWGNEYHGQGDESLVETNPNVNVIRHAGEVLALAEGGIPLVIDNTLETLGKSKRHPGLANGMTAHPKIDPVTGELITFHAHWAEPYLRYGVTGSDGQQLLDTEIDIPAPSMMHDMAITASHSILMDLNVAYDFSLFSQGYRIPIRWHEERQSRFGVIPRHGGVVRWFEIAPCFIQHVVNAYDTADSNIVLEVVRYPWYFKPAPSGQGFQPNPLGVLWRYTFDLISGTVTEQALDDKHIELPRINEAYTGRTTRYFYAVEQPADEAMRGIIRYDLETDSTQQHEIAEVDQNSEPVFVPRSNATAEDDGWILVSVYRQATDSNDILILDASDIAGEPVATVKLPRRIPAGFHGAWLPSE
ncbi:MAG: carotenoid oxygenase family protein [Pseudomonadota bacterium]